MVKYFIIFSGLCVGLFILVILLRKPRKEISDYFLMLWFLVAVSHLVYFFLLFNHFLSGQHALIALGNTFPIIHIFIISLYIDHLRSKPSSKLTYLYITITFAYIGTFLFLGWRKLIVQEGIVLKLSSEAPIWTHYIGPSFFPIYLITGITILKSIRSYRFNLKSIYSSGLSNNVTWLGYWLWSYAIGSLFVVMAMFLFDIGFISSQSSSLSICLVLSLQIFLVGQFGATHNFVFPQASDEFTKYKASGLKKERKDDLKQRLLEYLLVSKAYLNPNLSLQELAKGLHIPTYQVSQLINETLETTFYDLINQYRVEEFKRKFASKENKHLSILGIAYESGFNSKSSFYKAFKKIAGKSPTEFKKSLQ